MDRRPCPARSTGPGPTCPSCEYPADAVSPSVGDDIYFQWTPVPPGLALPARRGHRPQLLARHVHSPAGDPDDLHARDTSKSPTDDKCMPGPGVTTYSGASRRWTAALDRRAGRLLRHPDVRLRPGSRAPRPRRPTGRTGRRTDADMGPHRPTPRSTTSRSTTAPGNGRGHHDQHVLDSWTAPNQPLDPTKGPYSWTVSGHRPQRRQDRHCPLFSWPHLLACPARPHRPHRPLTPLTPLSRTPRHPASLALSGAGAAGRCLLQGVRRHIRQRVLPVRSARHAVRTKFPYPAATDLTSSFSRTRAPTTGSSRPTRQRRHRAGAPGRRPLSRIATSRPVTGQRVALSGRGLDVPGTPCTQRKLQ